MNVRVVHDTNGLLLIPLMKEHGYIYFSFVFVPPVRR